MKQAEEHPEGWLFYQNCGSRLEY